MYRLKYTFWGCFSFVKLVNGVCVYVYVYVEMEKSPESVERFGGYCLCHVPVYVVCSLIQLHSQTGRRAKWKTDVKLEPKRSIDFIQTK